MKYYFYDEENQTVGYKNELEDYLKNKEELDELASKKSIEDKISFCEHITGLTIETNKKNLCEYIRDKIFFYGMVKITADKTLYKELVKQIKEF